MQKTYTNCTIEKLVFGGQAITRLPTGQVCFVWNALPEEVADIQIIKARKGVFEAVTTTIHSPSPFRIDPIDNHFLSSSPWQIVEPTQEAQFKKEIAAETYSKIADMILSANQLKFADNPDAHKDYRNKMEFSFTINAEGVPQLALFVRGSKDKVVVEDALLADPAIMTTAKHVLAWIQEKNIPLRSLKSLIVRSNKAGETIAGLFIKDKLPLDTYPELTDGLIGFSLYYSTHKSPASVPTELMSQLGKNFLTENILGMPLKYGLFSFFQVNVPMFEEALKDIAAFLDPKQSLMDFYSGVGAIGLPLSQSREKTILVESNEQATEFAADNIRINNLDNCEVHCAPAEKITELLDKDAQLIVDPPRSGLHEKMIRAVLRTRPPRIVYLSCNLSTQARDMRLLSQAYKVSFMKLYNFFPRTPHIEGLVVMDRM